MSCVEKPLRPILAVKSLDVRLIVGGRVEVGDRFSFGDKHVLFEPEVVACRSSRLLVASGRDPEKERLFESVRKPHACEPSKSMPEPDFFSVLG